MNKNSSIHRKKKKALNLFVKKLLKSPAGKDIDRIILFGSLAWGIPRSESDVDIVILGKKPRRLEKDALDLSYDVLLDQGELIEPLVYPPQEYHRPKSAIVMKAILDGQEIYTR